MSNDDTMHVLVGETMVFRSKDLRPKEIKVEVLRQNVNLFMTQIEQVIKETPDKVGGFRLSEFSVTAEVSAEGSLLLIGTGVKAEATGGLTFKFTRAGS
jgi:hypothetical protein